jgi:hypothetical protein
MRGSCCPGSLLASKTPGIEVVRIAMFPVRATMVPAAGIAGLAAGDVGDPLLVWGCAAGLLAVALPEPFVLPPGAAVAAPDAPLGAVAVASEALGESLSDGESD